MYIQTANFFTTQARKTTRKRWIFISDRISGVIDSEGAIALGSGTSGPIKMLVCENKINFDQTSFTACIGDEQSKGKLRFASNFVFHAIFVGSNRCVKTRNLLYTWTPRKLEHGSSASSVTIITLVHNNKELTDEKHRQIYTHVYISSMLIREAIKIGLSERRRTKNKEIERKKRGKEVPLSKRIVRANGGTESKKMKKILCPWDIV